MGLREEAKDVSECVDLLKSPEWRQYVKFISDRRVRLQKEVNDAIRKKDLAGAMAALAVFDDSEKQIEAFKKHVINRRAALAKGEDNG